MKALYQRKMIGDFDEVEPVTQLYYTVVFSGTIAGTDTDGAAAALEAAGFGVVKHPAPHLLAVPGDNFLAVFHELDQVVEIGILDRVWSQVEAIVAPFEGSVEEGGFELASFVPFDPRDGWTVS
jgi:hypothetical protein